SSVRLVRLLDAELMTSKHQVPPSVLRGAREMQVGFLQALFSADGTVGGTQENGLTVRLPSSFPTLLAGVQRVLLNFGIASRIYQRRKAGIRLLPNGRGSASPYQTKAQYELVIGSSNVAAFAREIGFLQEEKQRKLETRMSAYTRGFYRQPFTTTFKNLVPDGEEVVYDLTEPVSHQFIGNGLVLHNCGEQPLPPGGVCNLGALNLACYVDDEE